MLITRLLFRSFTFAPAIVMLACGSDHSDDPDGVHDHDTPIEVAPADAPEIQIVVTEDPMSGHNLQVMLENFELAPENASTEHVPGEGHMHLYVDGVKRTRLYTEWFYLGDLDEGQHEIRVELSANSHNPLALNGDLIDDETTITVAAPEDSHGTLEAIEVAGTAAPRVTLQVTADPTSGWNLHAVPENFQLAPENAAAEHVEGEGHMHLYVNDHKLTRLYGEWFYVSELPLGEVELRVELSANSHHPLTFDGARIEAHQTITVTESDSHSHDTGHEGEGGAGGQHSE